MRLSPAALACLALATPVLAQSPSRDWRPADRTVIGDFTYITSIAGALDRVYITSPAACCCGIPNSSSGKVPTIRRIPRSSRASSDHWLTRSTIRSGWLDPMDGSTISRNCSCGIRGPCRMA